MTKKAECVLTKNFQFVARADSGHAVVMDTSFGNGMDSAPMPMEYLLFSLMGCTGMDVVSILQKMRKPLSLFEITAEAENAKEHPKIYTQIHLHFRAAGENLDAASLEKAINLSKDRYCSVSAGLSGTAKVTYDYEILET